MNRVATTSVFCIVILLAAPSSPAAPLVSGYERFGRHATAAGAKVEAGLLLLGELGCVNCHAAGSDAAVHLRPKRGPDLTKVGERLKPEWFGSYLRDPHAAKPAKTMPHLLAGLPATDRERSSAALAHYLAASGRLDQARLPDGHKADPKQGAAVYERVGCAACHGSRAKPDATLSDQIPLVGIADKWTPKALDAFLADPLATRPGSRMPAQRLNDNDRRHVVASLLGSLAGQDGGGDEHADVVAFQGRAWRKRVQKLPVIGELGEPMKAGPVKGLDVFGFSGLRDEVVVRLEGFFHARVPGPYTFLLESDDGSRLFLDGRLVLDNDGEHPALIEQTAPVELTAGIHPIAVDYFESGGNETLRLDVVTPAGRRGSVLGLVTPTAAGTPAAKPDAEVPGFRLDQSLVAEGRTAFAAVGCANCHRMPDDQGKPLASQLKAKPLADLAAMDAGCLATSPRPGVAWYGLDDRQREAIAAAVAWLKTSDASRPPARERAIERTLTALNCYACHNRDGRGGVIPAVAAVDEDGEPVLKEAARDALFTSPLQELGDEGRLPPTLSGVGDKLRPEFLREVLANGGADRGATMHTLMPRLHPEVGEPLAALLADDPHTQIQIPELAGHQAATLDEEGRSLVGSKMLGCIKCHSFGGDKGQSLGLIDLVRMPKRLRHEWFLAYVADPQRFRPGTRMPAAWPEGKTFYADVVDGTAAGQIEAVWRYLSGSKPRTPLGVAKNPIELVPAERPIIYRNFIQGAGPRAIGVGYPERVHIAWDADQLRLAMAWRGAFIDAARHWTGRGVGFEPPLGDRLFTPDAGTPLAEFESESALRSAAWPKGSVRDALGPVTGHRFRGYRLDASGRPTFTWRLGERDVQDAVVPVQVAGPGGGSGLRRTITVSGPPLPAAAVRVASGKTIEDLGAGWHRVDKSWRVRVGSGEVIRREADGTVELRVPLVWKDGRAVVEEELAW